jgi:hypothetical protein
MKFDYSLDYKKIDFRKNHQLYFTGKGEQGVLLVEPYKSEILPYWRFKTPELAKKSSKKIYDMFLNYLEIDDFVGADMARKFLQMGYTRSRRYANHSSGRKYSKTEVRKTLSEDEKSSVLERYNYRSVKNRLHAVKSRTMKVLPVRPDPEKAESAEIFYKIYKKAMNNTKYKELLTQHKLQHTS